MTRSKVWVVCPSYYDTKSFRKVRDEIVQHIANTSLAALGPTKFLYIDDTGGQDPAVKDLAALPDVEVVRPPYNLQSQAALVFALRVITDEVDEADYIVTMDADGEDKPTDLLKLFEPLTSQPENVHRVALAARTQRTQTFAFKAMYFCFKAGFRALTGTVVRHGNFAAFRGWLLKEVIFHPHFDQCYSSAFLSLPLQVTQVPLARGVRYFGQSTTNYFGLVTHGIRMLMPLTERIAMRGIVFSVLLSFATAVAAVLHALHPERVGLWVPFMLLLFTIQIGGIFMLLFATFSQSKGRALRTLHSQYTKHRTRVS